MDCSELPAHDADDARGVDPEEAQKDPGVGGEYQNKGAADIQAQHILRQHQADGSQNALPESVTQDYAGMRRVELFIDVEPVADRQPRYDRYQQKQNG